MSHSIIFFVIISSVVGVSVDYSPFALDTKISRFFVQSTGRAALYAFKFSIGSVRMDGV